MASESEVLQRRAEARGDVESHVPRTVTVAAR